MIAPNFFSRSVTADSRQIRPRNFVAKIKQHFGYATHADAANADEMYTLNFCEQESVPSTQLPVKPYQKHLSRRIRLRYLSTYELREDFY